MKQARTQHGKTGKAFDDLRFFHQSPGNPDITVMSRSLEEHQLYQPAWCWVCWAQRRWKPGPKPGLQDAIKMVLE